jgi:hypothetical protein
MNIAATPQQVAGREVWTPDTHRRELSALGPEADAITEAR